MEQVVRFFFAAPFSLTHLNSPLWLLRLSRLLLLGFLTLPLMRIQNKFSLNGEPTLGSLFAPHSVEVDYYANGMCTPLSGMNYTSCNDAA